MGGEKPKINYQKTLILDCANGVGSKVMKDMISLAGFTERLDIKFINDD